MRSTPYLNFNVIIPHLPKRRSGRLITSKATARAAKTQHSSSSKWRDTNALLSFWKISPPYTLGEMITPFDKDRIYPLQGLVTQFAFKRYN